jgi:hypothetical protein
MRRASWYGDLGRNFVIEGVEVGAARVGESTPFAGGQVPGDVAGEVRVRLGTHDLTHELEARHVVAVEEMGVRVDDQGVFGARKGGR